MKAKLAFFVRSFLFDVVAESTQTSQLSFFFVSAMPPKFAYHTKRGMKYKA